MPADDHRVRYVDSFEALVSARFEGNVNALCWRRSLPGDFHVIVDGLRAGEGITTISDSDLRRLALDPAGLAAREVLLADQQLLRRHGLAPSLDCIVGYPRDEVASVIATDVYSFHVDRAPVEADTYLCTYAGACSEGLANEMAVRKLDDPITRAEVLEEFGGADGDDFESYCVENCFDLHYRALPNATPYSFGIGNLWRIAIAYPGCPVLPCIHRAPLTLPGDAARLLLIS